MVQHNSNRTRMAESGGCLGERLLSHLKQFYFTRDIDLTKAITIEFTTHGLRTTITIEPAP